MRRVLPVLAVVALTGACSLFGPRPGRIDQWFALPIPGSVYTYTITTTWHDNSVSTEERHYVVERVERRGDKSTLVKLADSERMTSIYWIVDRKLNAVLESRDAVVDDTDLIILTAPVEEGARWSVEREDALLAYRIRTIRSRVPTDVGQVRDVVLIRFGSSAVPNATMEIEWSPDVGLLIYEEDYVAGTSYLRRYQRKLTGIAVPD